MFPVEEHIPGQSKEVLGSCEHLASFPTGVQERSLSYWAIFRVYWNYNLIWRLNKEGMGSYIGLIELTQLRMSNTRTRSVCRMLGRYIYGGLVWSTWDVLLPR